MSRNVRLAQRLAARDGKIKVMRLEEHRLYSPAEVAEYLSVNVQTVRRWIHEGKLRAHRIGKFWRVSKDQ